MFGMQFRETSWERHTKWGFKVNRQRSRRSFPSSADCEHGPRVLVSQAISRTPDYFKGLELTYNLSAQWL